MQWDQKHLEIILGMGEEYIAVPIVEIVVVVAVVHYLRYRTISGPHYYHLHPLFIVHMRHL